jgi:mannose-6-phosphate isomerase-like protein (cupin superfamily)
MPDHVLFDRGMTYKHVIIDIAQRCVMDQADPLAAPATAQLGAAYDYLAPDGSEIRLLVELQAGGLCHCTLPAGAVSVAVRHRSVEEIWYILSGQGEVWRRHGSRQHVVAVGTGACLAIPAGTAFQFRNTGAAPLTLLIATIPRWPGPEEAVAVEGHWASERR